MGILWPDAVGNDKLLHVDVHEASISEPLLQLEPGTDLVAGLLECPIDFVVVPTKPSAVETAVFRRGIDVPVLEFNPAAGLD